MNETIDLNMPAEVTVGVGGDTITFDPYLEHSRLIAAASGKQGVEFLDAVIDDVSRRHGTKLSGAQAHAYYKIAEAKEKESTDFFTSKLASLGLSDSTPKSSVDASGQAISQTSAA